MRKTKQTRKEMFIGLIIWAFVILVVLEILCVPLRINHFSMAAGAVIGIVAAVIIIQHMYRHLDIALDMDAGHAQRHTQMAAMQRMFIMAFVMGVSFYLWQYIHPAGVIFGIFGIKITAFLNPIIHKWFERKRSKSVCDSI